MNEWIIDFSAFIHPIFLMVNVMPEVTTIHKRAFVVIMIEILDRLTIPKSRLYSRAKAREVKVAPARPNKYKYLAVNMVRRLSLEVGNKFAKGCVQPDRNLSRDDSTFWV